MARFLSERSLIPWGGGGELLPAADYPPVVRIPAAPPEPAQTLHETREPRGAPTVETAVTIPLLQTLLTAGAVAVCMGMLAWAAGWSWRAVAVVIGVTLAGGWFWRLGAADRLLWAVESWVDHDLNGDGNTGRPVMSFTLANPAQARQAITRENRQADADAERQGLLDFVDRCVLVGTGERSHQVAATGPARRAYTTKRDTLLTLGVARWKHADNPRGGWELTCSRHRARQILEKHVLRGCVDAA